MKQPCELHCPDRSPECHGKCEKWLEYEKERNKAYIERNKEKEINRTLYEIERKRKEDIALGRMHARKRK